MHVSMKSLLSIAALSLAVASTAAHAATTTIDFNGIAGNNFDPFTTYTEGGFTVSAVSGDPFIATTGFGDPVPDIFSNTGSSEVAVTDGGSLFTFDSVDLANYNSASNGSYTITGFDGLVQEFTFSGNITGVGTFSKYNNAFSSDDLTKLDLTLNGTLSTNLDNIVVGSVTAAPTPEPSSIMLLGTGLAGLGGLLRRRILAA